MAISVIALTFIGKIDPKDYYALVLVVFYHYYNKPKSDGDKSAPQEPNVG